MRRRDFIAGVVSALSWPIAADAQQIGKMPRIGILNNGSAALYSRTNPFLQGLRELGYTEGQNLAIEFRFADWQLNRLCADFWRRRASHQRCLTDIATFIGLTPVHKIVSLLRG
jgi:hypothetical protein